jgi:hypothetical protein
MTTIVGLMGPAGSGKSSVAAYLSARYGARRYSLASPLKEIARRALGFTDEQLYGTQEQKEAIDPRYGFSPRWFLQKLGTEGCRAVLGDDVWTRACLDAIRRDAPMLAVIEDVRFANEAAAICDVCVDLIGFDFHGRVWRLEPPRDVESRARADKAGAHASELEWLHAPYTHAIAPIERGLPALYALVDDVAAACNLRRLA